jgi:hypothetical protein
VQEVSRERWARPLQVLPRALFRPERPGKAILVGWLTALLPSLLLSALVSALFPKLGQPQVALDTTVAVALVAVFAPLVETLIMAGVLAVLLRFLSPTAAVVASSAGWAVAHSLAAPAWGLVIWWPFLIFSILYVTWRQRSLAAALAVPAMVHGLQNLLPALLVFSGLRV